MFNPSNSKDPSEDVWTIWSAEPTRNDLSLVRRWGLTYSTKASHQFNVYQLGDAFLVTLHTPDGTEVERDATGLFHGGKCARIGDAWEVVAKYTSSILSACGMVGASPRAAVIFDTTPEQKTFHLSSFEYINGAVQETRNFDPDSRMPLASPVPPSRIPELNAVRHYNAELLSKVLDAAVYRMSKCPLAAELLSEFPARDESFEAAKCRYVMFVSWCARRSVIVLSKGHPDVLMILGIMDAQIQQQFEKMLDGMDSGLDLLTHTFSRFDGALNNKAMPWESATEGEAASYWLNRAAIDFIFATNCDWSFAKSDGLEKWSTRLSLPVQVMLEVHAAAKAVLAGLRWLSDNSG